VISLPCRKLNKTSNYKELIMINESQKKRIIDIWNTYIKSDKVVLDVKGQEIDNINDSRKKVIQFKSYSC